MAFLKIILVSPSTELEEILLNSSYALTDRLYIQLERMSLKELLVDFNSYADLILCERFILSDLNAEKLLDLGISSIFYDLYQRESRSVKFFSLGLVDHILLPQELEVLEALLMRLSSKKEQFQSIERSYLSGLGTLAAGLAHEINNPIGYMQNNLAILEKYLKQTLQWVDKDNLSLTEQEYFDFIKEDQVEIFEETRQGIGQITGIINDLRAYSKVDYSSIYYEINLSEEIDQVIRLTKSELYEGIEIERIYNCIGRIIMDQGNIGIALMNVLKNSLDALHGAGTPSPKILITLNEEDHYFCIEIEDNGPGIEAQDVKKIFEPFFTTKPVGSAIGLGLSTVYRIIVEDHKGEIKCVSEKGKYTKFIMRIPRKQL